ncbi:ATP-binding protein [Candidatus Micrarchaeota archaeon]|nr:ATP-binding protein [Candidatus Micrarchaeota archaeon]
MYSKTLLSDIAREQLEEVRRREDFVVREKLAQTKSYSGMAALVIKGVRRCGKSTLLKQVMRSLFPDGFYYFNFDDDRILDFETRDFQTLMEAFVGTFGEKRVVFFDEIQNVRGWELFVNRLLREGYRVFLTGSNADLLSQELGTHMTGRHVDVELYPFSFREFLHAKKLAFEVKGFSTKEKAVLSKSFAEYMERGGMPEAIVFSNDAMLSQVVNDIIQKDILRRYRVGKPNEFRSILRFLLNNVGNKLSFRSVSSSFGVSSPNTVQKYIEYAEETYLVFTVNRFDMKIKRFEKNAKKIYCVDNGIVAKNSLTAIQNRGALLENLVAVEFKRRGRQFYYYVNKNGSETDFITVQNNAFHAVQVCVDPINPVTMEREQNALVSTMKELKLKKGTFITMDYEEIKILKGMTIEFIPAWKWLLEN